MTWRPVGRGTAGAGRRDLAEREVFGEAARRELLERAVEQEQEGAPGGIGAPRAPGEEGRDARAMERGLEEARVGNGRAEQDRHAVERRAVARLLGDAARDLDRLPSLAGRGEEDGLARLGRARAGPLREEILAEMSQGRGATCRAGGHACGRPRRRVLAPGALLLEHRALQRRLFTARAELLERGQRAIVSLGHGDQHLGRDRDQRRHEGPFGG